MQPGSTNRLLGYPEDQRLLILNADDFGMCHAVNQGIIDVLEAGIIRSTSLMVCTAWANEAAQYLRQHPEVHFGVHLTAVCDSPLYNWGPCLPVDQVPALVTPQGRFWEFEDFHNYERSGFLPQLELEFRKQIHLAYELGLQPDHLDWHSIRLNKKTEVFTMLLRLAREFKLPLRTFGVGNIKKVQALGLPCNDYDLMDSYVIRPTGQPECYKELAKEIKPGLNEWAIHPGIANEELMAIDPTSRGIRQRDHDYWISPAARQDLDDQNALVLDYTALQPFWQYLEA
ncbi:MAG TPA: ChbG/HpnK family deacetylase [Anaerolineaceae bacterium]|nr:ChbG/HpnK family deacetylase [Anaerolineaceae bacterium]